MPDLKYKGQIIGSRKLQEIEDREPIVRKWLSAIRTGKIRPAEALDEMFCEFYIEMEKIPRKIQEAGKEL